MDPVVTRVGEQCNVNSVCNQRASSKGGLGVSRQAEGEVRNNVDWLLGHQRARYIYIIVYKGRYKPTDTKKGNRARKEGGWEQAKIGWWLGLPDLADALVRTMAVNFAPNLAGWLVSSLLVSSVLADGAPTTASGCGGCQPQPLSGRSPSLAH
jgi:hypothetical protein